MTRYLLTPVARDDIVAISNFISQTNPLAAQRVRATLREAMRKLARRPGIGHLREDLADEPLRFFSVHRYLIIYRAEVRPIQVVRVLHGSRDVRAILRRPP